MIIEDISEEEALQKLDRSGQKRVHLTRPDNFPDPHPIVVEGFEWVQRIEIPLLEVPDFLMQCQTFWAYVIELTRWKGISEEEALQKVDRTGQRRIWYACPDPVPTPDELRAQTLAQQQELPKSALRYIPAIESGKILWDCVANLMVSERISEENALQKLDLLGLKRITYIRPPDFTVDLPEDELAPLSPQAQEFWDNVACWRNAGYRYEYIFRVMDPDGKTWLICTEDMVFPKKFSNLPPGTECAPRC